MITAVGSLRAGSRRPDGRDHSFGRLPAVEWFLTTVLVAAAGLTAVMSGFRVYRQVVR
jgi:hypothetical protein